MNKTYSKKHFYYRLFINIFICAFIFFSLSSYNISEETGEMINPDMPKVFLLITLGIYIVLGVYSYLFYKTSKYSYNERGITCQRGVFFKRKSFLEYHKIHSVNKKQGIIQQIFKIAYLVVDSGSTNTAHTAEILIIEDDNVVEELMKEFKKRQNQVFNDDVVVSNEETPSKKENLFKFTSKRKILYSLLNSMLGIVILLILSVIGISVCSILVGILKTNTFDILTVAIYIILGAFGIAIFTLIGTILFSFIEFYNYRIYKENNTIDVNYGLLVKNHNNFKIERVKGVRIKQNIIKRIFGFVSIDVEVIGYGNMDGQNNRVTSVLIPLCKESEVNHYLELILPKYIPQEKEHRSTSYFALYSWSLLIPLIVFVILGGFASIWLIFFNLYMPLLLIWLGISILYLVVTIFTLVDRRLQFSNEGITICEDKITLVHGGFNKTTTVILVKNIIGIDERTTPLRQKNGISSYAIHFRSNAMTNTIFVDILSSEVKEKLLSVVKF